MAPVDPERLSVEVRDGIADVRLNRPDKRNALDIPMFQALVACGASLARRVADDDDVRVVVLSGAGASFCAGLDMAAMAALAASGSAGDPSGGSSGDGGAGGALGRVEGRTTHLAQQSCWTWQELAVPVIAAVHGHALGGGIQLALAADVRIVHPDTKLSVREVYWGLTPDMTGTLTLARLVRPDVAKELVMTARIFDGREAAALGLATRLADDPYAEAMALAAQIAERSPAAVRGAKELFNTLLFGDAAEAFATERRLIGSLIGGPDQAEAVAAHFDRRPPRFGRR